MFKKLLLASTGDIAVRAVRAAQDLGIATVAVFARDDAGAQHSSLADAALAMPSTGPAVYLDIAALIQVARLHGCYAVHPGYGFLSERADFAQACADAGLVFAGPTPTQLALFGNKARARALAAEHGVPLRPGTAAATLTGVQAFFEQQRAIDPGGSVMLKAVAGGGGRGRRVVREPAALARHLEVQVLGDGRQVMSLGGRECTLQRRFQKPVEIAPSSRLAPLPREQLLSAALTLARWLDAQGQARPASGLTTRCDLAQGPGVRVDSQAFVGLAPSAHFDSLLAKLNVHHPGGFAQALRRSQRALAECRLDGLASNQALLRARGRLVGAVQCRAG